MLLSHILRKDFLHTEIRVDCGAYGTRIDNPPENKQLLIEEITFSLSSKEVIKLAGIFMLKSKLAQFWNCFYFSFSTFTAIGVGDWYPRNAFTKFLVMLEGALGWISLGLFITSYGNLLLR